MMKAIKNFMNKPITWGDSFKSSVIALGLYAIALGVCEAYMKWMDYKNKKAEKKLDVADFDWDEI